MPGIYPFNALQFNHGRGDLSELVAPPYDVLDAAAKLRLLSHDPRNIVSVDLPHTPAKELGPPEAYATAADTFTSWRESGVLTSGSKPAIFAYRQTFTSPGGTFKRHGMAVCVDAVPFGPRPGGGVLPHEETFSGPKEDRMALMKATHTQLSPIFGLHQDATGKATKLIQQITMTRPADCFADMGDGVIHEVWRIEDGAIIQRYQDALTGEDVFIADGHHRYSTQLNYLKHLESQGVVPLDHPARRCMMVLVSMNDPGLVIWPTHRVLGGMKDYTFDAFLNAGGQSLRFEPIAGGLEALNDALIKVSAMGSPRVGLYDFATKRAMLAIPAFADPLKERFAAKPPAWRGLDVAFVQYGIVEEICQNRLNGGQSVQWAFPHTIDEVEQIGRGAQTGSGGGAGFAQLAVLVRPTPLSAVRDVSRAGELMPQKSTFFYPKLATGLFINPLS